MLYSEFRDGNVPAGHEQLRVMQDCLRHLPDSVKKVSLRSDTAGYQEELLLYCGEGADPRFGVIDFAVSADVTQAFRAAVLTTRESEWKPLVRMVDGEPQKTDQEWAEVAFVPNWAGHSRNRADYRFLAIREPLRQLALGDEAQLPFPTQDFGRKGLHKLFGVVTNRKDAGDNVIWWLRERCGKSEEVHSAMKSASTCDLMARRGLYVMSNGRSSIAHLAIRLVASWLFSMSLSGTSEATVIEHS